MGGAGDASEGGPMSQVAERQETLAGAFVAFRLDPAFGPAWLAESREAAFARFRERGLPTAREEEWRFTSVAPIAGLTFARAAGASPERPEPAEPAAAEVRCRPLERVHPAAHGRGRRLRRLRLHGRHRQPLAPAALGASSIQP